MYLIDRVNLDKEPSMMVVSAKNLNSIDWVAIFFGVLLLALAGLIAYGTFPLPGVTGIDMDIFHVMFGLGLADMGVAIGILLLLLGTCRKQAAEMLTVPLLLIAAGGMLVAALALGHIAELI
ncbi:MAG: hypothetical protein JWN64_331 [Parcubacteria group bacterium]|nr:hypothetical protein [Parcubacteria group bacterium]